jgi:hypothetical protein
MLFATIDVGTVSYTKRNTLRMAALVLLALLSGPILVPWFFNTDPVIAVHGELDKPDPISGWYGPGAWATYVLTLLVALVRMLRLAWHIATVHAWLWSSPGCERCPCVDSLDGDLLVASVYALFSVCDLICCSIPITHVDSSTSINPSDTPALQAAVTSTHIGFGAVYVPMLAFSFFVWSAWQGSYQEVVKAHWRRGVVLGVMFIVTHTGVSVCERVRSSAQSKDISLPARFILSRLAGGVFAVVTETVRPTMWMKIISIFSDLTGPVGAVIIYGIIVFGFLFLQSSQKLDLTWDRIGATLILAYMWPICTFILIIYFVVLVSGCSSHPCEIMLNHMSFHSLLSSSLCSGPRYGCHSPSSHIQPSQSQNSTSLELL